jgi:hypothetical protein
MDCDEEKARALLENKSAVSTPNIQVSYLKYFTVLFSILFLGLPIAFKKSIKLSDK